MSNDLLKFASSRSFEGLSNKLAEDLVGIEQCKPVGLIEGFPRIMEKINDMWPARGLVEYINGLIISDRIDRGGFPPKVMGELCFLKELQGFLYPLPFESNQRIEDLLHSRFQTRGIRELVELYGPRNAVGMMGPVDSEPIQPSSENPTGQSGWGEIDSDADLTMVLQNQHRPLLRLGEILTRFSLVSDEDRNQALATQQSKVGRREPLGKILIESGKIAPLDLRKALVLQSQGLLVNLDLLNISHPAFALVPLNLAIELGCIPLQVHGTTLVVALDNPLSYRGKRAIDALRKITGLSIRPAWASTVSVESKLKNYRPGRPR